MTIIEKLKSATASFHTLCEQLNFSDSLFNHTLRKEDYLIILKRLYFFFTQAAVLQKWQESMKSIPALFFDNKAGLVHKDIQAIDDTFFETAAPFQKMACFEYMGFSYVAMGSMLGGQAIYQHIFDSGRDKKYALPSLFYSSCKDSVLSYWKLFMEDLKNIAVEDHESVIAGATTAYLYFIYLSVVVNN